MSDTYDIGVLGTGIMGSAMARRWLDANHRVRVWNRTRSKAEALADDGAEIAESPLEVMRKVDYVVTMVADGDAIRSILDPEEACLKAMSSETVWVQMSTVGADDADDVAALSREYGVDFIDAPVLGTKEPAESGQLTVLAAAETSLRDGAEVLFEPVAAHTRWIGEPGEATRAKLVCNNWVVGLLGVLAETLALAEHLDVEADHFFESIAGGPLDATYAHIKGEMMERGKYPASFPLRLALKDTNLILEAAEQVDLDLSVARGVAHRLERALEAGWGDEDMAAIIEGLRGASARQEETIQT